MGWQRSIRGLHELLDTEPATDVAELTAFIERFELCNSSFACPPIDEWERLVQGDFLIEEVFLPHEYDYCRFEPVYLLRRR